MRQLQPEKHVGVGVAAELLAVCGNQRVAQVGNRLVVRLGQQQLVRVGAAVVPHRHGFPAPEQLRAAQAEVAPAADGELRWPSVGRAVPAFHRQHAEAVADAHAVQLERPRERRLLRRQQVVVEVERDVRAPQVLAECGGGLQGGDAREGVSHR